MDGGNEDRESSDPRMSLFEPEIVCKTEPPESTDSGLTDPHPLTAGKRSDQESAFSLVNAGMEGDEDDLFFSYEDNVSLVRQIDSILKSNRPDENHNGHSGGTEPGPSNDNLPGHDLDEQGSSGANLMEEMEPVQIKIEPELGDLLPEADILSGDFEALNQHFVADFQSNQFPAPDPPTRQLHHTNLSCQCPICFTKFTRSTSVRYHMARYHDTEIYCLCKRYFATEEDKAKHVCARAFSTSKPRPKSKQHQDYMANRPQSSASRRSSESSTATVEHPGHSHDQETLLSLIKPCSVVLNKNEVERYLALDQGGARDVAHRDNMVQHQTTSQHKGRAVPTCDVCKKTFKYSYLVRRHKGIHHNSEPTCRYCRRYLKSFGELSKHLQICKSRGRSSNLEVPKLVIKMNGNVTKSPSGAAVAASKASGKPKCNLCCKTFQTFRSLRRHNGVFHNAEPTCNCGRYFTSYTELNDHKLSCGSDKKGSAKAGSKLVKMSLADLVGQKPQLSEALSANGITLSVVSPPRPAENSASSSPFTASPARSRPPAILSEIQRGKNGFQCPYCPNLFVIRATLRRHLAMLHGTEIMCNRCKRFFVTKQERDEHGCNAKGKPNKSQRVHHVSKKRVSDEEPLLRPETSSLQEFMLIEEYMKRSKSSLGSGYCCCLCQKKMVLRQSLITHIKAVHLKVPFCSRCRHFFKNEADLNGHNCSHSTICDICHMGKYVNIRKHKAMVHQTEPGCNRCEKVFDSFDELESHVEQCRPRPGGRGMFWSCDECDMKFDAKYIVRVHKAMEHCTEPICNICMIFFDDLDALTKHADERHAPSSRAKAQCTRGLLSPPPVLSPLPAVVMLKSPKPSTGVISVSSQINVSKVPSASAGSSSDLCCHVCKTFFKSKDLLNAHLREHKISPRNKQLQCHLCKRKVSNYFNLTLHLLCKHRTNPQCRNCLESFITMKAWSDHKRYCNSMLKPKSVIKQRNVNPPNPVPLETEITTVSTQPSKRSKKPTKHLCDKCNLVFYNLRRHNAEVHNTEPVCRRCRKFFATASILEAHILVCYPPGCKPKKNRTDLTPSPNKQVRAAQRKFSLPTPSLNSEGRYDCEYCHNTYISKKTWRSHMRNLHQSVRLECTVCNKTFTSATDLQDHMAACQSSSVARTSFAAEDEDTQPFEQVEMEEFVIEDTDISKDVEMVSEENSRNSYLDSTEPEAEEGEKCPQCQEHFQFSVDMKIHANDVHSDTHLLCAPCRLEFKSIPDFISHIHVCEKSKAFQRGSDVQNEEILDEEITIKQEQSDYD